jgi:hypothetical protein
MGSLLNPQNDNLWFTLLIKRRNWYHEILAGKRPKAEIFVALSILHKTMTGCALSQKNLSYVDAIRHAEFNPLLNQEAQNTLLFRAKKSLYSVYSVDPSYIGWGWKEPNSHIFLPYLATYFNFSFR